jgi:hypothetical protein
VDGQAGSERGRLHRLILSSDDDPQDEPSGDSARIRRDPTGPTRAAEPDDTRTGIIRRHPTGPIPSPDDTRTGIIRRQPSGPIPVTSDDAPTSLVPRPGDEPPTGLIGRPLASPAAASGGRGVTAIAAAAASIVSGWTTAVVASNLIAGWWNSDRLFCLGVGFLTAVFAASTVAGVILLLLGHRTGCYLTAGGAAIGLLIFASVFLTGAHVAPVVYASPALPVAAIILALLPATRRWTAPG